MRSGALARADSANYGEFLASLEMTAEIGAVPSGLSGANHAVDQQDESVQSHNQTVYERGSRGHCSGPRFITLYGRLADKFGDNGLVSVLIGHVSDETVQLDLWLMSCRVLKREMEFAMFDALVEQCQARGIRKIVGVYIPSKKNSMVAGHYAGLGFSRYGRGVGRP